MGQYFCQTSSFFWHYKLLHIEMKKEQVLIFIEFKCVLCMYQSSLIHPKYISQVKSWVYLNPTFKETRRESTLSSENICWLDLTLGLFVFSLSFFLSLSFCYFLFDLSKGCLEDLRNVFQCLLGPLEVFEKFSVGGGWWVGGGVVTIELAKSSLLSFFLTFFLTWPWLDLTFAWQMLNFPISRGIISI